MLLFPKSKLNLGLRVLNKRQDGFHNIQTVFYPLHWCEALELLENKNSKEEFRLSCSGIPVEGKAEDNLIYKAWKLVKEEFQLPSIKVHLHKNLPMGAGLGGGSADAACMILLCNEKFSLGMSKAKMKEMASKLGSDCAFFIESKAVLAEGKGDEFTSLDVDLSKYYILVVYPALHSNTALAYSSIRPYENGNLPSEIVGKIPVVEWKDKLINDFEEPVMNKFPAIRSLKEQLYKSGAIYASMSGSGSAVLGIFDQEPEINFPHNFQYFLQNPVRAFWKS